MKRNLWRFMSMAMVAGIPAFAQPDWSKLEVYQKTISADSFVSLLNEVYAPDGLMTPYLRFGDGNVAIFSTPAQTGAPLFILRFDRQNIGVTNNVAGGADGVLAGLRIALDPGHIGGAWARMEERFFLVDRQRDWPVQEAALNLYVSRLLRDRLVAHGADVVLVKDDFEPMATERPDLLLVEAGPLPPPDARFDHLPPVFIEAARRDAQRKNVERQFYRNAEITARAQRINNEIKPDLTLCIHFNATGYGDEKTLFEENGLTFFVHGNYQAGELIQDEQKFFLLRKLLEGSHPVEWQLAESIAASFVAATGLPPSYDVQPGGVMHPLGTNRYIYARNLSANRQFRGPVVFLEPYFMNNRIVYARIQAGDYEGEKEIEGVAYRSIFREYADAVAEGVTAYYAAQAKSYDRETVSPEAVGPVD